MAQVSVGCSQQSPFQLHALLHLAQEVARHHRRSQQTSKVVAAGLDFHIKLFAGQHAEQPLNVVADDVLDVATSGPGHPLQHVGGLLLQVLDQGIAADRLVVAGQELRIEHGTPARLARSRADAGPGVCGEPYRS